MNVRVWEQPHGRIEWLGVSLVVCRVLYLCRLKQHLLQISPNPTTNNSAKRGERERERVESPGQRFTKREVLLNWRDDDSTNEHSLRVFVPTGVCLLSLITHQLIFIFTAVKEPAVQTDRRRRDFFHPDVHIIRMSRYPDKRSGSLGIFSLGPGPLGLLT